MRVVGAILRIFFLCSILADAGCEPVPVASKPLPKADNSFKASIYTHYVPMKVDIMPLTEFVRATAAEGRTRINAYVSLLDSFGCQMKSPGLFRFELYERVPRSAEPKGKRVVIWPDIDLADAVENNKRWRDFLRTYEFNLDCRQTSLDFEPASSQSYILQVTFLCPSGKRLSAEFVLKYAE